MYGRNYYNDGCGYNGCDSRSNGWSALFAAGAGIAGGYLLARNTNGWNNGFAYPYAAPFVAGAVGTCAANSGCQTCFQQGEYTGENRAGINYIANVVNANSKAIADLGNTLAQQKITDQANEIQALKTQQIVQGIGCVTNSQLAQVNNTLNSIVTGCGVKSYPGCGCGC